MGAGKNKDKTKRSTMKKRKNFEKYSEKDIQKALQEIRSKKLSLYKASCKYQIPRTTLHNRLTNRNSSQHGKSAVLSKDQELELACFIEECDNGSNPLKNHEILQAAKKIAEKNPDPSKRFLNGVPSIAWLQKFYGRHPELTHRGSQMIGKASMNVTRLKDSARKVSSSAWEKSKTTSPEKETCNREDSQEIQFFDKLKTNEAYDVFEADEPFQASKQRETRRKHSEKRLNYDHDSTQDMQPKTVRAEKKTCRLCLTESEQCTNVSEFREGFPISVIVMIVCPVKVDTNDSLPKQVCEECLEIVVSAYKL
jgi:Zinc-finger associated domain (zf-AD)/helix-turn-helix, Psq domain/Tc5 transposase DNA-binding domain